MGKINIREKKNDLNKHENCSPQYGYYFFYPYIFMLGIFLVICAIIIISGLKTNQRFFYLSGYGIVFYGLLTTVGWALARYVIPGNRVEIAKLIIKELQLNGTEKVLDIGTGRGLYAIEAAKKMTTGYIKAIDIWRPEEIETNEHHHRLSQPTGNTIENARKNAKIAGVSEKVEFQNMDAANIAYPDKSFDVVICAYVLSHLWRYNGIVLKEIKRVLKNGGRAVLIDNVTDFTYFLLSTPHMFIWSYLKGRKARRLSENNWYKTVTREDFGIQKWHVEKGIITIIIC